MPPVIPGHNLLHDLPGFWLQQEPAPDAVILDQAGIAAHNQQLRQMRHHAMPSGRWDLRRLELDMQQVRRAWQLKLQLLRRSVGSGARVTADGKRPTALLDRLQQEMGHAAAVDEMRVVRGELPLRCYPAEEGLYEQAADGSALVAFDLAQCAQLRTGEPVRVLAQGRTHWYVWSTYGHGWVRPQSLTPKLSEAQVREFLEPDHFVVVQRDRVALWADPEGKGLLGMLRLGTRLPLQEQTAKGLRVTAPGTSGLTPAWLLQPAAVSVDSYPPFTRRNVLERAFSLLDSPYGWGGLGGHRDCSRLMMDLFAAFGIELPRNSRNQSEAGLRHVELTGIDAAGRREAILRAASQGIVLLYLPGHIMLYVGDDDGLHALHQFSGYLVPCTGASTGKPRETMVRVNRTAVTSLELGRGSSRTAFIERITRLVVLAPLTTPERGAH